MTRAGWLALALLASCGTELGPPSEWVPWDDIDGPLRPEVAVAMTPQASAPLPSHLRVVTYNMAKGIDIDRYAAAIQGDPDLAAAHVLLVQEIEFHPGEGRSRTARLAEQLGMGYVYAPARREGDGTHGDAILSVYPLENMQVMELPRSEQLISPRRRIALAADVVVGTRRVRVVNVHLDTRLNIGDRILQLRPAVLELPELAVVGGDFNTNPYLWAEGSVPQLPVQSVAGIDQADALDDYMSGIGFDTPTARLGTTQSVAGFDSRLDSIFSRGAPAVPGRVTRKIELSDHYPVWVDLDLR